MTDKAQKPKEPLLRRLYVQVLIGIAIGAALGHFYPNIGADMKPLGDGFIKLIKMLLAPVIFGTIVVGIARMGDLKEVGKVGAKALLYFEILSTIALVVGLVVVNVLKPGSGMNIDPATLDGKSIAAYTNAAEAQHGGAVDFVMNVIPRTIVGAFAEGNVLQIILFAVLFGCALSRMGDKARPLVDMLDGFLNGMFGIVKMVMVLAPIGAFGAIAFTIGKYGIGSLAAYGTLFVAQATNTDLSWSQQLVLLGVLMLTSKGSAGVAGAGFVTLAATLGSMQSVPVTGLVLLLGVDRFLNEARAITNLVGNGLATIAVARWEGAFDSARWKEVTGG